MLEESQFSAEQIKLVSGTSVPQIFWVTLLRSFIQNFVPFPWLVLLSKLKRPIFPKYTCRVGRVFSNGLIGLKFSERILFKFRSVFIYLLSKNIKIIKINIFNKSFFSNKSQIRKNNFRFPRIVLVIYFFKIFREYFIRIQECFYILTRCTRPRVAVAQFV